MHTVAKTRLIQVFTTIIFLTVALLFFGMQYDRIKEVGFCCADDTYFAMTARQIALYGQYGLPNAWNNAELFEPSNGSGPVLIVPIAFFIKIFGMDYRVPGLSVAALFWLPFLGFLGILSVRFGYVRALLYGAASLFVLSFLGQHHNVFGAGIGEAPMLGFLLLSIGVLGVFGDSKRGAALAGLCFGLSILTKQAAIYPAFGACAAWSLGSLYRFRLRAVARIIILAISTIIPFVLFELVKWATLGTSGYEENFQRVLQTQKGLRSETSSVWTALEMLHSSYALAPVVLAVLAVSAFLIGITKRSDGPEGRGLAFMLFAAMIFTPLYFVLSGSTNPRHLWLIPMLLSFLIAMPILVGGLISQAAMILVAFIAIGTPVEFWRMQTAGVSYAEAGTQSERLQVIDFINQMPDLPVYGQWWGNSFDVLYFLPTDRPWFITNDENEVGRRDAIYTGFVPFFDDAYPLRGRLRERCEQKMATLKHFELYVCRAEQPTPTTTDPVPNP